MVHIDFGPRDLRTPEQVIRQNCLAVIRKDHRIDSKQIAAKSRRTPRFVRKLLASQKWTMPQGLLIAKAIGLSEVQAKSPDISEILAAIPKPPQPPRMAVGAKRVQLPEQGPL